MQISQKGIDLIKRFEGCRLLAYLDPAGVPTIGYGHTNGVSHGMVISQERAEQLLKDDLYRYGNMVQALINEHTIMFKVNQNMFDSLTSFCYNLGKGNLIKLVTKRTISEVADKMLLYVNAGGKKLQGLVNRRTAERELFLTPVPEEVKPIEELKTYVVVKGDTLSMIAKRFKTKVSKLAEINGIKDVNKIYVGQIIKY